MSFVLRNKIEIRQRALLEAIRFCGGVTALSEYLKVSRTRTSNWVNQPEIEMPYEYALIAEDITQVSIERLSPSNEVANKIIGRLRTKEPFPLISMELSEIHIGKHFYLKWQTPDRPIIVGTDGILILGLMQIEICKASGIKQAQVMRLDLEALLLGQRSIQEMNLNLSIGERIAVGLRLEQMLGNRQGQRNDLKEGRQFNKKNMDKSLPLRITCDEVGRVDHYIVQRINLGSKDTYRRAKQVYLHGNPELIGAMDRHEISIAMAAKKVRTESVQQNRVQTTLGRSRNGDYSPPPPRIRTGATNASGSCLR